MSNKLRFVIGFLGLLLACNGYAFADDTLEDQEANEITLKMMTWVNHKLVDGMPAKLIYGVPKIPGWHLEGPSEASN